MRNLAEVHESERFKRIEIAIEYKIARGLCSINFIEDSEEESQERELE